MRHPASSSRHQALPAARSAAPAPTLDLPPVARSVPLARRWLADQLVLGGWQSVREAAELLVTEVVTNAVIHAGTAARLSLSGDASGVRVSVRDASSMPVVRRPFPGPGSTTGRGSVLLDALATRWGSTVEDGGKVTWFDLDLDLGVPTPGQSPPLPRTALG